MKRSISIITAALSLWGMATAQEHSVLSAGRWWKISVAESGVYSVGTRDIATLEGAEVARIGLYGAGGAMLPTDNRLAGTADLQPVRIDVVDRNANGLFDREDEVLFYGEAPGEWRYDSWTQRWTFVQHAYATENHYYLCLDAPAPARIATAAPVAADTAMADFTVVAHVENELVNVYGTGQKWMGERFGIGLTHRNIEVRMPTTGVRQVKVRYAMATIATEQATFRVSTNGLSRTDNIRSSSPYLTVDDRLGTDQDAYTFAIDFAPGESSGSGYLDFIELNGVGAVSYGGGQTTVRNDRHLHSTASFAMAGCGEGRVWEVTTAGAEREMAVSADSWSDSTSEPRRYVVFDEYSCLMPAAIKEMANQDLHGAEAADLVVVTLEDYREQAWRLAALHSLHDGMSTLVVSDEEVFNEYSSGKTDPMAIRALLRNLKERHEGQPPRYLVLFGKGSYDSRNLLGSGTPTLVTYETPFSFDDDGLSYASDDMMGYLSPTGSGTTAETLDVSTGRLPARTVDEATHLVDKIERYMERHDLEDAGTRGDWRNYVALLADDADPAKPGDTIFAHSSEAIATSLKQSMPQMNIDRLYADAYHQSSGSIGSFYPDLNNALRQRINYGCLLLNYIGHGSTAYIGTERYIEPAHLDAYDNGDRLPFFVTSTCSYGRYDQPDELSGAEASVLAPSAMIGTISASRPISHIERFNKDVVLLALDPANTVGDALRMAKNRTRVSMSICLIGDPALRLSQPRHRISVTHINGQAVDDTTDVRADVLSRVTVRGEIRDEEGRLIDDFDGTVYPIVFDRETRASTLANDNPGTEVSFWQQKNVLYKGSHPVSGGRFEYSFIVPRDVAYSYAHAKLSHYAKSATDHATGSCTSLMLGGLSDIDLDDATPPEISLLIGDSNFRPGAMTGPSPTLIARLSDSVGINVGSGLGHDITATIDGNANSLIVLNDLYEPDIDDSRRGSVSYTLSGLAPGRHTIELKAWNIFGLSAKATTSFHVRGADTLAFSELGCAPNPASERTLFVLRVNRPSAIASATLEIYNARGQMAYRATPTISEHGYTVGPVAWDVASVPPGLYLARMVVTDTDGETHQATTKCVVR